MQRMFGRIAVLAGVALAVPFAAFGDMQQIPPGSGLQNDIAVTTGPDGLCNTTALPDDIQAATVGGGTPNQVAIRCGANKTVETAAAGDDTQLHPVGGACKNTTTAIVDTGADGIADTTAAGDDTTDVAPGSAPPGTACIYVGVNGVADTTQSGDDVQALAVGAGTAGLPVVLCGPDLIASTQANNFNPAGDDFQDTAVGAPCGNANQVVVSSGSNYLAETRAEGPDLVLKVARPVRVNIPAGQASVTKLVKLKVLNVEYGASAPASRNFAISVVRGSCPARLIGNVDADAKTAGIQTTAAVPLGGLMLASFEITFDLGDITSYSSKAPFRCQATATAVSLDVPTGNVDDASLTDNNSTVIDFEIIDKNDL